MRKVLKQVWETILTLAIGTVLVWGMWTVWPPFPFQG